jgi:hypothetical protein
MNENELRDRVKAAVRSVPVPQDLEQRIRHRVQREQTAAPASRKYQSIAWAGGLSAAVVISMSALAYQRGYLRPTAASQERYNLAVCSQVGLPFRAGLGDHVHCAVFGKHPQNPPRVEQFVHDLGPQYADLLETVQGRLPADYRIITAHRCSYHGRRFVHLAFRSSAGLSSLIIADQKEGEMLPVTIQDAAVQRFQIAAFGTRSHLVYFISDSSSAQNQAVMSALAPAVRSVLDKIEG